MLTFKRRSINYWGILPLVKKFQNRRRLTNRRKQHKYVVKHTIIPSSSLFSIQEKTLKQIVGRLQVVCYLSYYDTSLKLIKSAASVIQMRQRSIFAITYNFFSDRSTKEEWAVRRALTSPRKSQHFDSSLRRRYLVLLLVLSTYAALTFAHKKKCDQSTPFSKLHQ